MASTIVEATGFNSFAIVGIPRRTDSNGIDPPPDMGSITARLSGSSESGA